jgi:hypothetical protein
MFGPKIKTYQTTVRGENSIGVSISHSHGNAERCTTPQEEAIRVIRSILSSLVRRDQHVEYHEDYDPVSNALAYTEDPPIFEETFLDEQILRILDGMDRVLHSARHAYEDARRTTDPQVAMEKLGYISRLGREMGRVMANARNS